MNRNMRENTTDKEVIQNLKDAGCNSKTVEQFIVYVREGKLQEQFKLLLEHRKKLLDKIHKEEKMIDCLDYLVYKLKKQ